MHQQRHSIENYFDSEIQSLDRKSVIKRIKLALQHRSGKKWSVTGDTGTAWAWITIDAPPSKRIYGSDGITVEGPGRFSSNVAREELCNLLDIKPGVNNYGISIPGSNDYYIEYIDRAEGRVPRVTGKPYWD